MKLWILTTEYPPQSGGGISTYCWHTAKMMAAQDVSVTVFIPASQSERWRIVQQDNNIRLVYFRQDNNPQNKFLGWEAALSYEFSNVLKEFQDMEGAPDLVESQEYLGIAYYALQRRLLDGDYLRNCVFFVTAHAPSFLYLDYNQAPTHQFPQFWIGEMERSALRTADFVLSPSQYLLTELEGRVDLKTVSTEVLRNPYLPLSPGESVGEDLVFFGKLTPQKGGLEMLQYFQEMWNNGFRGKIHVIGSGDHFFYPKMMDMGDYVLKRFEKYVREGLLVFEGHIEPAQLETRLSKARAVIIPSTVDNLPYTVLEAMSMGKIVLVSTRGGHAELVQHAVNGFTFSHDTEKSFENAVNEIYNLTTQQVLEIGLQARQTVARECSYEVVFDKKMSLLKRLGEKRSRNSFPYIRPRPATSAPEQTGRRDLLSIVIPYFNLPDFIEECVQSIFNSDFKNIEVIIINDGSHDQKSIDVLNKIEGAYPVRIIHQKNQGLCKTRNIGAQLVTSEYLAFLDADDMVDPLYYGKAVRILKAFENVHFVGCWAQYFGENDEIWAAFNPEPPYLLTHNTINSSAVVYKTDSFLGVGGNDPVMVYGMEDYETIVNMVKHGLQGVVIPEVLWHYRIRTGSMAQSFNRFSELYLYRLISRKHALFIAEYAEDIVNMLNANGPGILYNNPTLLRPAASQGLQATNIIARNGRLIRFIKQNKILRKIAKKIYTRINRYR